MVSEPKTNKLFFTYGAVLILVVMEDGLREFEAGEEYQVNDGLNPCCYGRWSQSLELQNFLLYFASLNPCCYGRWSQRGRERPSNRVESVTVLILVVMEDGLREHFVVVSDRISQS